jgi:hypothetical protein
MEFAVRYKLTTVLKARMSAHTHEGGCDNLKMHVGTDMENWNAVSADGTMKWFSRWGKRQADVTDKSPLLHKPQRLENECSNKNVLFQHYSK